jgi:hypothetical protein
LIDCRTLLTAGRVLPAASFSSARSLRAFAFSRRRTSWSRRFCGVSLARTVSIMAARRQLIDGRVAAIAQPGGSVVVVVVLAGSGFVAVVVVVEDVLVVEDELLVEEELLVVDDVLLVEEELLVVEDVVVGAVVVVVLLGGGKPVPPMWTIELFGSPLKVATKKSLVSGSNSRPHAPPIPEANRSSTGVVVPRVGTSVFVSMGRPVAASTVSTRTWPLL